MYCPECGKELREGARFCPICGKKVKEIPENIRKATSQRKRNHFLLIVILFVIIFFSSIGIAGKALLNKHQYDNVNEKAFNDYITYDDHFLEIEAKYLNENGYVNSEDVIQLLEEIESAIQHGMDRGIINSYSKENKNIHIQFTSGIQYIFIPYEEGILSNGIGGKIMTIQPVKDSYGVRLTNFLTFIDKLYNKLDYVGSYLPDENANMIKKAFDNRYDFNTLTFDPYSFKPEFAFSNEDVTIDAMKKLDQYKIIIFEGHGGYTSEVHSALVTGETFLGFQEFSRYKDDIKTGNIILSSFPTIGESNAVYSPVRNFCVTSKFFDTYLGEFDDSLIFLGACFSAKDKVLAQSLINKGASIVLGYSESTSMEYEMMTRTMFFYGMTCTYAGEYLTVEQALNYAKNQIGWTDPWGGKNAELVCLSKDSLEKVYTLDGIRKNIESDDNIDENPDTDANDTINLSELEGAYEYSFNRDSVLLTALRGENGNLYCELELYYNDYKDNDRLRFEWDGIQNQYEVLNYDQKKYIFTIEPMNGQIKLSSQEGFPFDEVVLEKSNGLIVANITLAVKNYFNQYEGDKLEKSDSYVYPTEGIYNSGYGEFWSIVISENEKEKYIVRISSPECDVVGRASVYWYDEWNQALINGNLETIDELETFDIFDYFDFT